MKILPEYFDRSQFTIPYYDHHIMIKDHIPPLLNP